MAGQVIDAPARGQCSAPGFSSVTGPVAVAVGVDVVDVGRFCRLLAARGADLTTRVFTAAERRESDGQPQRLAARLAVKEATAKALGTGIGPIGWRDVEVVTDSSGAPSLRLHGAAAAVAGTRGYERSRVSLSHEATHAVAFVILMGKGWSP